MPMHIPSQKGREEEFCEPWKVDFQLHLIPNETTHVNQ